MDENTQEPKTVEPQGKTFTQSENDRLVGLAIVKEREKFADYADTKQQLETLLNEKKERDLSEKTEVEKLQSINSELTTELTNVRGELTGFQKKQLRTDVLNGGKYLSLPRAYKSLVTLSDSTEEIQKSADEVLAEFEADTGKKVADTFGIPEKPDSTISTPSVEAKSPEGLAASLRSKLMATIKNNNRG